MEIDPKHMIGLDGFTEQGMPYQCPECNQELRISDMIGMGLYPKGGYRSALRPNRNIGAGFECPKCGVKSCFHADDFVYKMYLDWLDRKGDY